MTNVEFDDLRWLNLLWAVLAVALVGLYGAWQKQRGLRAFASVGLLLRIAPPVGWARPLARLALVALCLTCLTAAIVGPRWGEVEQKVVRRGIDVMVLLDVSRSMLARDIAPNRLERAKLSIRDDLLPALGGDRVGVIAFAGVPTLKCPLTSDYGFVRLVLDEIDTESSPRGGTLIGDAIRKAKEAFGGKDDKSGDKEPPDAGLDTHKVILLITDGEDHESYPVEAARAVWEEMKVPVVAVALGDEREGARIPVPTRRGQAYVEYKGETVWSKADFETLRKVAAISDLNAFVPVGTKNFDLGAIYREKIVPAIEYKERVESEHVPQPAQYHWFAWAALGLLLIDSFLRDGPPRRPAFPAVEAGRREAA